MNINNAIIIATGKGINGETLDSFGELAVGGIPQLKRQIIIAERAGINSFIILTDKDSPLENSLKDKLDTKSDISWSSVGSSVKLDPVPYL
ncbi:MAG: hypothetical protein ACR2NC_00375, partial [Thermodesulfobacteriota bacterium]